MEPPRNPLGAPVDLLGWRALAERYLAGKTVAEDALSIPTLPAMAALAGASEVEGPLDITWRCCSLYELRVGRGTLISTEPREPGRGFAYHVPRAGLGSGLEKLLGDGRAVNPLGWAPLSFVPAAGDVAGVAVSHGGVSLAKPAAEPWSPAKDERREIDVDGCPWPAPGEVELLGYSLVGASGCRRGPVTALRLESGFGVGDGSAYTLALEGSGCARLRAPYYDVGVSVLYPLKFVTLRLRDGGELAANAAVIYGDRPLAVASADPIAIRLRSGVLELCPRSEGGALVTITQGGQAAAARQLIEMTSAWDGRGRRGLGSVRPGAAAPVVASAGDGKVHVVVVNPTDADSSVVVRLSRPLTSGRVCSPLGCYELEKSPTGLARIPAPSGCYCVAELSLGLLKA